jgi:uncharacterized protein YciI
MKVAVFYDIAHDGLPRAAANSAAHRARLGEFHARGVLLMAGPFANPSEGALAIFATRDAADEFVKGDPFVLNGVVCKVTVREWNESLV